MDDLLKWDVFVTPGIPVVTSDLAPGALWSSVRAVNP